jgi:S1/P1 Nuclease
MLDQCHQIENAMSFSRLCAPLFCVLAVVGGGLTTESFAWGPEAHRTIALLSDRLLQAQSPAVQNKILDILSTDKSNDWTRTDIASEATWADALREKSPEGRVASSNWHYAKLDANNPDLNKACFGRPALPSLRPASHGPQDNCIVDKIEQFAKELREPNTSESERLMALQFLLNLVGDIHDPLYLIEHNDQGGRCVAVLPPGARTPVRLSVYWDDTIVAEAVGKDPIAAAGHIAAGLTSAEIQKWSDGKPEAWAQESYNLAKSVVYGLPTEAGGARFTFPAERGEKDACGPLQVYRLDTAYRDRAMAVVKEQLAKAGIRLAFLLRGSLQ